MNKYCVKDEEVFFYYKDTLVHECLLDFIYSFYEEH